LVPTARSHPGSAPRWPLVARQGEPRSWSAARYGDLHPAGGEERFAARVATQSSPSSIETRRLLLALANTLDESDLVILTKIAQGLAVLRQSLDEEA
jgi:hypothetical protein